MNRLGEAAQAYARQGVPVFPCHWPAQLTADESLPSCSCSRAARCDRTGKHPLTRNGLHATTNLDIAHAWWQRWPQANIGLATAVVFDALDIDKRQGVDALRALGVANTVKCSRRSCAPGVAGTTCSPPPAPNRTRLAQGVDWRGKGGYIITPPSRHSSGHTYRWVRQFETVELARPPATLIELLTPEPQRSQRQPARTAGMARPGAYGQAVLTAELSRLQRATKGSRNSTLNRAAFRCYQLAAAGLLDPDQVTDRFTETARAVGLGEAETRRTLASASRAGHANPRSPRADTPTRACLSDHVGVQVSRTAKRIPPR
jgi:hypothetical protein